MHPHITNYCFEKDIGSEGLGSAQMERVLALLEPALAALQERSHAQARPLLELPFREDDLDELESLGQRIRARFRHVVVAGSGGSGLSGRTLLALRPPYGEPHFHFLENVDPDGMEAVLAHVDPAETCFLAISKSGTTVETLSQLYVLIEHVKSKLGTDALAERFFLVTTPGDNPMRRAAAAYGFKVIDHAEDIGGRFSIFTNVGLLPAAIAGLDIRALRRGARAIVQALDKTDASGQCEAAIGAALHYAFIERGRNLNVMLPYAERLSAFSAWYRQNWAESLGKDGKGSTPIRAQGTTDQHSQLQLYLDGPKDKFYQIILLNRAHTGPAILVPEDEPLEYMRGKTMGDIMEAEQNATVEMLIRKHCPVRIFQLDALAEEEMGGLLMHFILEIIFMSTLLKVNAFDQPAVEEGKVLAREYLLADTP